MPHLSHTNPTTTTTTTTATTTSPIQVPPPSYETTHHKSFGMGPRILPETITCSGHAPPVSSPKPQVCGHAPPRPPVSCPKPHVCGLPPSGSSLKPLTLCGHAPPYPPRNHTFVGCPPCILPETVHAMWACPCWSSQKQSAPEPLTGSGHVPPSR